MTELEQLLAEAGLTGRGGAAYPAAHKIAAARANGAGLIVNACDGEMDAAKDWFVVSRHLEELVHGAGMIARETRYAARTGSETLNLLVGAGLPVLEVPDRYVASEESALIALAHGGAARPVSRERSLIFGGRDTNRKKLRPTLVMNAETVWSTSQIVHNGPRWFRSFGTFSEPGPRLVTTAGAVRRHGVLETAAGVPITELLQRADADPAFRALSVGGLSGGFLTRDEASGLRWDGTQLADFGCSLGSGVIRVIGGAECPVAHVARTLDFAGGQSAGQCGPCMFGVPAVAADFAALATGDRGRLTGLQRRLGLLPGRGACHFPDGVARYLAGALRVFGADLDAHRAGTCVVTEEARYADAS
ncbi:NADH-ubiquinone oxidoreductase-F iron-sulfur binding region domain-containing protein [Flexivirga oryzae]|uniref:NADH:ubiquinone oxidoreductase subunit F (NADH-binding) n=1 Tax=Flexivirga oryzae TaxID=1794944 RepID=A0A839N2Y1_9MICO|nr:NADH-ubiquinone oxidoreductase-F iron-sulfur binding region domain-containing protein [Flexivirga oryzae]MBB2890293.1 NADH:ubiquinone oxidoreductase subunit F (NADH-binding) [Flexivirga oryzae]